VHAAWLVVRKFFRASAPIIIDIYTFRVTQGRDEQLTLAKTGVLIDAKLTEKTADETAALRLRLEGGGDDSTTLKSTLRCDR